MMDAEASAADSSSAQSPAQKLLNFPPFYTKQINEDVLMRQKEAWQDIILEHFKARNKFVLHLTFPAASDSKAGNSLDELFFNSTIKRKVSLAFMHELVEFVVKNGNGAWIAASSSDASASNTRSACLIYWKKPDHLAKEIATWIDSIGASGNVYTVYELLTSDEFSNAPFHNMEIEMFFQAILSLQKQKRVEILPGAAPMEYGITFI